MDALIELCEVTKRYAAGGVPALDRFSMRVSAGEAAAVMGPSGSGKSDLRHGLVAVTNTVKVPRQKASLR